MLRKENILGVGITTNFKDEILEYLITRLQTKDKKIIIVTPNPEMLVASHHDNSLKTLLNSADIALPDGTGLLWASTLLGKGIKGRLTGVDFMKFACDKLANQPFTVGFLGGRGNVAELTANCLKKKYPNLKVSFVSEEWGDTSGSVASPSPSISSLTSSLRAHNGMSSGRVTPSKKAEFISHKSSVFDHPQIDLLFVAFGFPKQERWIAQNLNSIPVQAAMGVGGAFDYISGNVARAPRFVQKLGFEWLFRLIRQPWRIKRQLALVEFVWLVIRERVG